MELAAWETATGLAERNHNIKIITTSEPAPPRNALHPRRNLTVEYLNNTKPGQYSAAWWRASRAAYLIEKDRFVPDVIFSISAGAKSVLSFPRRAPVLIQMHGTSLADFCSKIRSGRIITIASSVRNLMWIPQDMKMFRKVEKVVAVGPAVHKTLRHPLIRFALPEKKIAMIPNAVDTEQFSPDKETKIHLKKKLGVPEKSKVLVSVSRLHLQKGIHLSLKAFSHLKRDDLFFLIVGDGPEKENLRQLSIELKISNRVVFAGEVAHDELPSYLSVGDVFVFTTTWNEGLPLILLEAMAMDLPCVISDHLTDTVDSISMVKGIYATKPTDISKTSTAITKALSEGSSDTRSFIEKNYSKQLMLDRYEQLLRQLIVENNG
jgi:glycosyltransferase involved in cell wall biosynthesis